MLKSLKIVTLLSLIFLSPLTNAAGNMFGFYVGLGIPYVSQAALSYVHSSKRFSVDLSYNNLSLDAGLSSASLTKPEINFKWHPFAGAFYLGVGVGKMDLEAEATDINTGETARVEVSATTLTPTLGWMWGMEDGGFFGGMEIAYQIPSSPETTLTTNLPPTDQAYIDAVDQADDLGETAFPAITLIRLGYLF